MKKFILTTVLMLVTALSSMAQLTFTGAGGNITDATESTLDSFPGSTLFTINVSNSTNITKLNRITINGLKHDWADDLSLTLIHNGVNVIVFQNVGGAGNYNGSYTFDDVSPGLIGGGYYEDTDDIPTGTYHSEYFDGLTYFNGYTGMPMAGVWSLLFEDRWHEDVGSFSDWSITFNDGNNDPAPDPNAVPEPGPVVTGAVLALSLVALIVKRKRKAII